LLTSRRLQRAHWAQRRAASRRMRLVSCPQPPLHLCLLIP